MNKVDIIIPTTMDNSYVNWCINSIQAFDISYPYEITVVDNLAEPKFERAGIKSIRFEERMWFAKAINRGIEATSNEYVLLLNNDTGIAMPNLLGHMIEVLNSEDKIGIVSPMCNFASPAPIIQCPNKESLPNKIIKHNGHIAFVCVLLKRSTINEIGLLDEQFKNAFCDSDYCTRVLNAGYKIYIDGFQWIFHYGSRTVSRIPGYYEEFGKNHDRMHKKWNIK